VIFSSGFPNEIFYVLLTAYMSEIQIITVCDLLTKQDECLMQSGKRSGATPLSDLENKQIM
jgi:hypothetical protein